MQNAVGWIIVGVDAPAATAAPGETWLNGVRRVVSLLLPLLLLNINELLLVVASALAGTQVEGWRASGHRSAGLSVAFIT